MIPRPRIRLITRHHLELEVAGAWMRVAEFAEEDLERAKRIALEEAHAPSTEDIPSSDEPTPTE